MDYSIEKELDGLCSISSINGIEDFLIKTKKLFEEFNANDVDNFLSDISLRKYFLLYKKEYLDTLKRSND